MRHLLPALLVACSNAGSGSDRAVDDTDTPSSQTDTDPSHPAGAFGGEISLSGRQLLVDGDPLQLRGVCWNPVGRGDVHPSGIDFAAFAPGDIALMKAAGINAVRTYEPLLDVAVLDQFAAAEIYVLNSVYPYGGDPVQVVTERVEAVRDHPAILMWLLGNEWNYNGLYVGLSHEDSVQRIREATALVRAADSAHPVATVYGEVPSSETLAAVDVDLWGINAYRGIGFTDLFDTFEARSAGPMFLSEYGADAYNALISDYDPDSQADATTALTQEILSHGDIAIGGTIFEWADEWWKDESGSPDVQDVGGIAPGGGPHPDQTFNEEWWGIVDIDRNPRPAYDALKALYVER